MSRNIFKTGDQLLSMIQERYPGYHPIIHVADIAHDNSVSTTVHLDACKVLLKYMVPDVKSIDISTRLNKGLDRLELLAFGLDDLEAEYEDVTSEDSV